MRSVVANQTGKTFAENLKDALAASTALRDALIAMVPSASEDEAAWIETITSEEVSTGLGFLLLLVSKNAQWTQAAVTTIGNSLAANVSTQTIDTFTERFVTGQVRAEMTCPCGQCPPCISRKEIGDDAAEKKIAEALRPKRASRLVDGRGRKLQ